MDWITPFAIWTRKAFAEPTTQFSADASEWSSVEIEQMLRGAGIDCWGMHYFDGTLIWQVPTAQADACDAVLAGDQVELAPEPQRGWLGGLI